MKSNYFTLFVSVLFFSLNAAENPIYTPATDGSYTPPTPAQAAYYYTTSETLYDQIKAIHEKISTQNVPVLLSGSRKLALNSFARKIIKTADEAGYITTTKIQKKWFSTLISFVSNELAVRRIKPIESSKQALSLSVLEPLLTPQGASLRSDLQSMEVDSDHQEETDELSVPSQEAVPATITEIKRRRLVD